MTDQPTPPAADKPHPGAPTGAAEPTGAAKPKLVFTDPFAQQTSDDTDEAWGERSPARGLDWYLEQRPPHHGG
ncbi:hypothetical protein C7C46_09920 [Streptomyces tateyamensis]|uniref:Uncharacterized protein n=1 Tax=Streptomyces tateyamensis TaxID=565073 RepID=A0A2V4NFR0_9ACTN|nr:hypothetical protein [Streptomyces tateyamensis]PYC82665.1 hypothetical protein C7C46_09920 [Streptomyces tateyamensis]